MRVRAILGTALLASLVPAVGSTAPLHTDVVELTGDASGDLIGNAGAVVMPDGRVTQVCVISQGAPSDRTIWSRRHADATPRAHR